MRMRTHIDVLLSFRSIDVERAAIYHTSVDAFRCLGAGVNAQ